MLATKYKSMSLYSRHPHGGEVRGPVADASVYGPGTREADSWNLQTGRPSQIDETNLVRMPASLKDGLLLTAGDTMSTSGLCTHVHVCAPSHQTHAGTCA